MQEKRPRPHSSSAAGNDAPHDEDPAREETPEAPSAPSSYENIPVQGTHRGEVDDPLTSSVRAQKPVDPTPPAELVEEDDSEQEGTDEEAHEEDAPSQKDSSIEKPTDAASTPPDALGAYQLSEDPASGRHRVRVLPKGEAGAASGGGFKEISRYPSEEDLSERLREDLPKGPRFIVLENTETGQVHYDRASNLSDDWRAGGRFDQMTVFESENEAARYADERQGDD